MSTHILTLFGEEIVPEQLNAVGRKKATPKKKKEEKPKAEKESIAIDETEEAAVAEEPKQEILVDWEGDKKYYSIGEVAKLFDVRTSNIRYWTKEFALKVRTTRKGDRLYTPEQIKEIRTIYHLVKHRGFTINGAKAKLKESKKVSVDSVDLKDSLLQLRNKLVQLKNSIK
ncbi:MAG: MerR family transcriptional regulator [Chitinophagales bacterium]|nr:MerR family transcriptional regulator [Chitinophagales bacterium]